MNFAYKSHRDVEQTTGIFYWGFVFSSSKIKSETGGDENYAGDTGVAFDFVGTVDTGIVFEYGNLVFCPFRRFPDFSVWILVELHDREHFEDDG